MKVIVIGAGKVGREICRKLAEEKCDVIVIDTDEAKVTQLVGVTDIKGVVGMGELVAVQREAEVPRADLVIAVTEKDETNILCCLIAKTLKAKQTAARVRDIGLAEQSEFMRDSLGIDLLINPEYETAVEISRLLRYPAAANVDYSDKARVDIVEVGIEKGNALIGEKLKDAAYSQKLKILVCAVARGGGVIIPKGDFVFAEGDKVFVTGKYQSIDAFFKRCGMTVARVRSSLIIGGGRIARYLAESLHDSGIAVKIIEPDLAECTALADELDFATVIHGDGTDKTLLSEEGADSADAFITLTGSDEINIMASLYAKGHGVGKIVTKINSDSLMEIASSLALGATVSPKDVVSQQIVRYVRSLKTHDESMLACYTLLGGKVQATAFRVDDESLTGSVRALKLKSELLIAAVVKGGAVIIPDGETKLEYGDVILAVSTDISLKKIEDILL